ncbi:hypothetical protein BY458DRAFT_496786 [Sporodiniella umbellata]|nr:hypothetical protein BY458DRAFT_496786 [Sporodiniella umbellata]
MKITTYILYLFAIFFVLSKAEDSTDLITDEVIQDDKSISVTENRLTEVERSLSQVHPKPTGYIDYLHDRVRKVKTEMADNYGMRTSVPFSFHDVAFSLTRVLPHWMCPPSLWKQNYRTRRRQLSKFFTKSPPHDRIHAFQLQRQATQWAKSSDRQLREEHATQAEFQVRELFSSLEEFIKTISHDNFLDLYYILEGCTVFEDQVNSFLENSNRTFEKALDQVNKNFDLYVNPSGGLRVVFESIRYDTMEGVRKARDQWYQATVHNLATTSSDVQSLLNHVILKNTKPNSLVLTKLKTISQLQARLKKRTVIHNDSFKYRKEIQYLWKQVIRELDQSPWQVEYWTEALLEVHEAAIELGKNIYRSYKQFIYKKKDSKLIPF